MTQLVDAQGNVLAPVQQSVLQNYVNTPVSDSLTYPKLAAAFVGGYVAIELLHHVVLGTYIMPYLTSTFMLGATTAGVIMYGALAAGVLGLSYLAYRYFFKPKPKAKIVQVMPTQQAAVPQQQVQYVPVQQVVPQTAQQVVQPST